MERMNGHGRVEHYLRHHQHPPPTTVVVVEFVALNIYFFSRQRSRFYSFLFFLPCSPRSEALNFKNNGRTSFACGSSIVASTSILSRVQQDSRESRRILQ